MEKIEAINSRTEEIQARSRNGRFSWERGDGGSLLENLERSSEINPQEHLERVSRFWNNLHKGWLIPIVTTKWPDK